MRPIKRRSFLTCSAGSIMAAPWSAAAAPGSSENATEAAPMNMDTLPNYCAHEHWGSIDAIGKSGEGYRADTEAGAVPARNVSVWDLVLDPYLGGWIGAAGMRWDELAKTGGADGFLEWWRKQPAAALEAIRPHLERQRMTGAFQCVRRGIRLLYNLDIASFSAESWSQADQAVAEAYGDLFGWYGAAMKKARFSELIRPVHPEFYFRSGDAGAAEKERAFTRTVLRIDPLLDLWKRASARREALGKLLGVEPTNAASWRRFLDRLFEKAAQSGALGIKQLQAYHRPLAFLPRKDKEIEFTGALNPEQILAFQDWVVHECCQRADDRAWPHQIHVGTHNLEHSSPLPLETLARRYGKMKLVLLHCWPFIEESGWLAKHLPNVYLDICWQNILNPEFFRESLTAWLNYMPWHKIMCSHDATSIEMAAGASLFLREILAERLPVLAKSAGLDDAALNDIAANLLRNNAVYVYGAFAKPEK